MSKPLNVDPLRRFRTWHDRLTRFLYADMDTLSTSSCLYSSGRISLTVSARRRPECVEKYLMDTDGFTCVGAMLMPRVISVYFEADENEVIAIMKAMNKDVSSETLYGDFVGFMREVAVNFITTVA